MTESLSQWSIVGLSQGAANFALSWLMQSTLLILAGLAIARCLARQGSAVQFVVYCTTLAAVLICPLLSWTFTLSGMTQWSLAVPLTSIATSEINGNPVSADQAFRDTSIPQNRVPPVRRVPVPKEPPPTDEPVAAGDSSQPVATDVAAPTRSPASSLRNPALPDNTAFSPFPWMEAGALAGCLIWLSVSAWLLSRLTLAWFRLAGIRRQAVPADGATAQLCQSLSRKMGVVPPAVLHTPFLPSPCLAGLLKPAVLLPEVDLAMTLSDVLVHELAHLRRGDGHWNLLRKVTTGLFWFQPLLWVLSRRLEMAAEEVCDDFVVEFGGDRADYAHRLVDVAEFSAVPMSAAGVAMVSLRSMLAQRVARIMDTSRRLSTRTSRRLVTTALAAGSTLALVIGLLGATPTSPPEQTASETASPEERKPDSNGRTSDARLVASAEETPATSAATGADTLVHNGKAPIDGQRSATPLPGLISTPPALPGNRRWQMYTKYPSLHADAVGWSADGRWLALATGQIVRIFDVQADSREMKYLLVGHTDAVRQVRFSPTQDLIATASLDGTVKIWTLDGQEKLVYRDHKDAVQDVGWHPDGKRLASGSLDGTVRIWNLEGKTLASLSDHEAPVNAVSWNPNGELLASGCQNKAIRYWSADGQPVAAINAHIGPVMSLAWNLDGTKLLSCDWGIEASDGQNFDDLAHMKTWDTEGRPLETATVDKPLSHCCWSPDGQRALAGGSYSMWMWRPAESGPAVRMAGLKAVTPVAWQPSGDLIAVGSSLRDSGGQPKDAIPLRNVEFGSIGLKPDGTLIGAGRSDRNDRAFYLFTSDGRQTHHSAPLPNGSSIDSMAWSPDGTTFIPGQRRSQIVQRYDAVGNKTGNPIQIPNDIRSVAWSRDGRYVVTGGDKMVVTLVDLVTGKAVSIGQQEHYITNVRFTPDQQQICSTGYDGCIRFWTLDGQPVKVLEAVAAPIRGLAWTSDGELMATGHEDHTIRFWNREGEVLNVINGHGDFVEAVDFNPAGTLLASASRDHSIRIWSRDGEPVSALRGHAGAVMSIQWTADGRQIVSGADDGTIRAWDVETGIAHRVVLLGQSGDYVTLDAQGRVLHGDENILDSDFAFFAEDGSGRLARTEWTTIRNAIQPAGSAVGQTP